MAGGTPQQRQTDPAVQALKLLATALASYAVDGRAATTLPLLAAAGRPEDAELLPGLAQRVARLGDAVEANAAFLSDVLAACPGLRDFVHDDGQQSDDGGGGGDDDQGQPAVAAGGGESARERRRVEPNDPDMEWGSAAREQQREGVWCMRKQLAREWSEDGTAELQRTHEPVLEARRKYVPGAGCSANVQ